MFWFGVLIGSMFGACAGFVLAGFCAAAKRADEDLDREAAAANQNVLLFREVRKS